MGGIKMTEWKEYTGSDEQIAELSSAKDGFMLECGYIVTEASELSILISDLIEIGEKYIICK